MSVSVQYAENYEVVRSPLKREYGRDVTGYGRKIATDRKIRFHGEKRLYRVYAICYSNVASHYVIRKGQALYCRGYELEV